MLSHVLLLAIPWTAAHQAPPSMEVSRQEYWSGVPLPSPFQVGYLVLILIHQDKHGGKGAGLPGKLIAGHVGQTKGQRAAREVAAMISFQSAVPAQQRTDLALFFQPCIWCVFSTPQWGKKGPSLPESR